MLSFSYITYRVAALAKFYPAGISVSECRTHHEEKGDKFVKVEGVGKFEVSIENGVRFTAISEPISMNADRKALDDLFLQTFQKAVQMVFEHAQYNIHEGS